MDKIHDIGGMHGFGAVDLADTGAYRGAWEQRVPALRLALALAGHAHGSIRPHIESLPAPVYLSSTYYERWARAIEASVVAAGLLSKSDLSARAGAIAAGHVEPPIRTQAPADIRGRIAAAVLDTTNQAVELSGRFKPGDRVRVKRMSPSGHTRCPRYVRGVEGIVERVTGGFGRPDPGDHPVEQTYTVRFQLHDIWGEHADEAVLHLDLWEGYLT